MHLGKLPSGSWRVTVKHAGLTRRATRPTKGEAQAAGAQLLLDLIGEAGPTARATPAGIARDMTVAQLFELHRERAQHSNTYAADAARIAARLPPWIRDRRIAAVTTMEIEGWYVRLGKDPAWTAHRIHRVHVMLSAAFSRAVKSDLLRVNPFANAQPPTLVEPEIDAPPPKEIERVLAAADGPFRAYLILAADTGARRGELLGLRWADVDLEQRTVRIVRAVSYAPGYGVTVKDTKTRSKGRRTVRIAQVTADALGELRTGASNLAAVRPSAFVWSRDLGANPHRPDWVQARWTEIRAATGVTFTPNALRHGVATSMLAAGNDPVKVSRRLGHSRTSTTMNVYAHLVADAD